MVSKVTYIYLWIICNIQINAERHLLIKHVNEIVDYLQGNFTYCIPVFSITSLYIKEWASNVYKSIQIFTKLPKMQKSTGKAGKNMIDNARHSTGI